jgi:nucleotide-binding universal stress UspA family protein
MYNPAPEMFAENARVAEKLLAATKASSGIAIETVRLDGAPAFEILRFAGEHQFDLIVMGTHGRRGFRRIVMGSVAEAVVREAKCAVLTVHVKDDATTALAV